MKQSTAKALIIATAKAHGVKSQAGDVLPAIGALRAQAVKLSAKGQGNKAPANTVYNKEELFAVAKGIRKVMDQVQNIPEDEYRHVRDIMDQLKYAAQNAGNAVYGLNKGDTARGASRWMKNVADTLESTISNIRRLAV